MLFFKRKLSLSSVEKNSNKSSFVTAVILRYTISITDTERFADVESCEKICFPL